jgi:hypothetical protein
MRFIPLVALLFGVLLVKNGVSQSFSALQNSNYSGVNGIYTNPASLTLMTHKRSANIGGLGFELNNDYATLNAPFSLWDLMNGSVDAQYKDAQGKVQWNDEWIQTDLNKSEININMSSEFRGPAYANQYGRFVWGTATRTRSQASINNMSVGMWNFAKQWVDSQRLINPLEAMAYSIDARANSYQEISAVLGYRLVNNSHLKLGLAFTGKGILGMGSLNVRNSGGRFAAIGMDTLMLSDGYMELAYTDNKILNQLFSGVISGSFPSLSSINGFGYGLDLGISMEIGTNMQTDLNAREGFKDYTLRLGAAVLDIGSIGYRNQNTGYIIDAQQTSYKLALNTPEFVSAVSQGSKAVLDHAITQAQEQGVLKSNNEITQVELPTTLQLQADWRIVQGVFVAAHWQQALRMGKKWEFAQFSSLAVVPRFEHKWFEVAMPLRYQSTFNRWSFGAHLRTGPVFIGTDNMANIFKTAPYSGMTFYMGITTLIR